jgi:hypothetical protein
MMKRGAEATTSKSVGAGVADAVLVGEGGTGGRG